MIETVIELNDSEIRVARGTDIILRSPGFAVVQKDRLALGDAAVRLARLNPRATYSRYWSSLNQDPLQYPTAQARHNADLAYAQLLAIHAQAGNLEETLFAVPGHYSNDQLALLLGLVEASPIKAIGLVDSAVAAAAPYAGKGEYVHAEIYLHQTILTHINVSDHVSRTSVQVIGDAGLSTIHDAAASLIADLFIKQSRFDPQHHAETDQALYNQIPGCLLSLRTQPEVSLDITYQDTQHLAKLPRDALLSVLQPIYEKIIHAIPASTCLVGDRLANLAGFVEQLSDVEVLDPASLFQGCLKHASQIHSTGPALNFVTRLPATSTPAITSATNGISHPRLEQEAGHPITHILNGHHAYPLGKGRLYLSAAGGTDTIKKDDSHCSVSLNNEHAILQPESGLTVYINGRQLSAPAQVRTGDIISFAGSKTEYTFISVLN